MTCPTSRPERRWTLPARRALVLCALAGPALAGGTVGDGLVDADDCNAPDVISSTGLFPFDNSAATSVGPDHPGTCEKFGQPSIENDVWCVWTSPLTGVVTVQTCGLTGVDTKIAAYDGTGCVGALLACNDDTCSLQSSITFAVTGGTTYKLRIGTFASDAGGTGSFEIVGDGIPDCDGDGIPDFDEVDCDGNGIPDECDDFPDCNGNGIPDPCDTCAGVGGPAPPDCSQDCNLNDIPDECEPDCDGDGVPDDCDPDSCEPTDLACEEFDRFADLTPNDTLTVIASQHNPQQEQGYLWVYAVNAAGQGIAADWLIGQELVVDGLDALEYAVNAVDYRAAVSAGALTDVDADGVRDLDGIEYGKTAGEILVPRFLGSDPQRQTRGELVLVGLSGGSQFTTTVDFLVYNDDEDAFSAQYSFYCWDKVHTLEVSNLFSNDWLKNFSGQNPAKGLGQLEYGWFRMNGDSASSGFFSLLDPAIYAVYIERIGDTAAADLPFEDCSQSGHLLPRLVTGDNSETPGARSDEDCEERLTRREPASLLLYPEFDSRSGIATVITVTNASETDDVRAHFVYVGRYGN